MGPDTSACPFLVLQVHFGECLYRTKEAQGYGQEDGRWACKLTMSYGWFITSNQIKKNAGGLRPIVNSTNRGVLNVLPELRPANTTPHAITRHEVPQVCNPYGCLKLADWTPTPTIMLEVCGETTSPHHLLDYILERARAEDKELFPAMCTCMSASWYLMGGAYRGPTVYDSWPQFM